MTCYICSIPPAANTTLCKHCKNNIPHYRQKIEHAIELSIWENRTVQLEIPFQAVKYVLNEHQWPYNYEYHNPYYKVTGTAWGNAVDTEEPEPFSINIYPLPIIDPLCESLQIQSF